jgi:hypothetical protein
VLLNWILWQRTSYFRRSDFRVVEENENRIVLRTRNYGILFGGVVFVVVGFGITWLGFAKSSDDVPQLIVILGFSLLVTVFGALSVRVSRTQRDTIIVDRAKGFVRSERARKRKKRGGKLFETKERHLAELEALELRHVSGSANLDFLFRDRTRLKVDFATDVEHLRNLGEGLAQVAGVELVVH